MWSDLFALTALMAVAAGAPQGSPDAAASGRPQLVIASQSSWTAGMISKMLHWVNPMPGSNLTPDSFILFNASNPGSGLYPARAFNHSSLPRHTIYAPIGPLSKKLPVVLWGNGGCLAVGTMFSEALKEIASHGYMVLANGYYLTDLPNVPLGEMKGDYKSNPLGSLFDSAYIDPAASTLTDFLGAGMSSSSWQIEALDWAAKGAANGTFGQPDMERVAVAGQSCGGMQAYDVTFQDPRIQATALFNSGSFFGGRSRLAKLTKPIAIFNGGPKDIAYTNGETDWVSFPEHLPAVKGEYDAGHLGTFFAKDGGAFGKIAVAFFDAVLKNSTLAQQSLLSNASDATAGWNIETKNWG